MNIESPKSEMKEIRMVDKIRLIQETSGCREQSSCEQQPIIQLLDDQNKPIIGLDSSENPWKIKARIYSSSSLTNEIIFESETNALNDGFANFTRLGVAKLSNKFVLEYELIPPNGVNL